MSTSDYVFGDRALSDELKRLQLLERDYDIQSQARLVASALPRARGAWRSGRVPVRSPVGWLTRWARTAPSWRSISVIGSSR